MLDGITLDKMLLCVPVYALCTENKKTGKLTARYYTLQLTHGREPTWGVWTIRNNFVCEVTKKEGLKRRYPKLVQKRLSGTLGMVTPIEEKDAKAEREMLAAYYHNLRSASRQDNRRAVEAEESTVPADVIPEPQLRELEPVQTSETTVVPFNSDIEHAA